MKREKQTSRAFYRHSDTGQIVVIEQRSDGAIVASCPATEPLRELEFYQCKADNNLWVMENNNRLVLIGPEAEA